jgi:hypothetical protein
MVGKEVPQDIGWWMERVVYHPHSGYTEARPCSTDAVHDRMGRANLRSKQGIGNIGGSEPKDNNSTPAQTRVNIKIYIYCLRIKQEYNDKIITADHST